jgi:hypothetical protein
MKLPITIEFLDGSSETYIVQPPEWVKWEAKTGNTITQATDKMGLSDFIFLAYSSMKRNSGGKPVKAARCMDGNDSRRSSRRRCPKSFERGSLSRLLVELAIATSIPMKNWETAEEVLTALEILEQRNGK